MSCFRVLAAPSTAGRTGERCGDGEAAAQWENAEPITSGAAAQRAARPLKAMVQLGAAPNSAVLGSISRAGIKLCCCFEQG